MVVLGTSIDLELAQHGAAQRILWQHTLNSQFDDLLRLFDEQLFEADGLQVADLASVVMIHLVGTLVAGDGNLLSVDDDDVITCVYMRRIFCLVLATQAARDFGGQTAKSFAIGVNNKPIAFDGSRLCTKRFHQVNPKSLDHFQKDGESYTSTANQTSPYSILIGRLDFQPRHGPAIDQMLVNDLVHILLVHIGVPGLVRIDDDYRPLAATTQATRIIDTYPTLVAKPQRLDPLLGVIAHRLGIMVLTASGTILALIGAKEDMVLEIGHGLSAVIDGGRAGRNHKRGYNSEIIDIMAAIQQTLNIDPKIKREADRCVMCGLCLPHCPTYNKTQNEAESPRGRLSLIQALASDRLEADTRLRGHLESCLLCRACEAKCPSGVQFGAIMDGARNTLAQGQPRPEQRINLDDLATDKGRQRREATLLWLTDKTGLRQLGRTLGITKALGLERLEQLAPSISRPHTWQEYYPASGDHQGDVALFTGCFGDMFDQVTLDSAITLLNACGYGVHVPGDQTCCGALHQHCGDSARAQQLAEQNLSAFGELNIQTVISCATGCGGHLKEYPRTTGKAINVCDINTFLTQIKWPETIRIKPLHKRIAVHEPCSLRNILKEADSLYTLLQHIPAAEIIPLPGNERCCGAAGRYMIDHPEMADALRQDKVDAIQTARPDILVSANIGCALHIAAGLRQSGIAVEVLHPVTLLARQLESGVSLQP